MARLNRFIPFAKVDDEKRIVAGVMTSEAVDVEDEVLDYDAAKKAIFKKGGYNEWRTVRSMHQPIAAGVADDIVCDDEGRTVLIEAKVVDDNEWKKVKAGVYKGFSVGGYTHASTLKKLGGRDVRVHTDVDITEVSLVDRPANPEAVFTFVKIADSVHDDPARIAADAAASAVTGMAAGEAMNASWDAETIMGALAILGQRVAGELSEGEPEQAARLQGARKLLLDWLQAESAEVDAAIAAAGTAEATADAVETAANAAGDPAGDQAGEDAEEDTEPLEEAAGETEGTDDANEDEAEGEPEGDQMVASEEDETEDDEEEDEVEQLAMAAGTLDLGAFVTSLCQHPAFAQAIQTHVTALLKAQIQKGGKPVAEAFTKLDDVAARLGALEKRVRVITKRGAASGPVLRDITGIGGDGAGADDTRIAALDELIKGASDPAFRMQLMQERARLAIRQVQAGGGNRIG